MKCLDLGHAVGVSLLILFMAFPARAQDSTGWYKYVQVSGLLSASYTHNFNQPTDRKNQLRIFDVDANSLLLDEGVLTLRHDAARGEAGFRTDITVGPYIPEIIHSTGLDNGKLDFTQLYLSYDIPILNGITIDFGKFLTPVGYEYVERAEGISDNASRSFLFGYSMPYTHTGLRISTTLNESTSLAAMLVNGWDNTIDSNDAKTFVINYTYSKSPYNFSVSLIHGAELPHDNSTMRSLADITGSLKTGKHITLGINLDAGIEDYQVPNYFTMPLLNGEDTTFQVGTTNKEHQWGGVDAYVRCDFSEVFALTGRFDVFHDPDGVRTGSSQTLHSYTLTPRWQPNAHFLLRSDLRLDHSSNSVFNKNGVLTNTQPTVSLNALYIF